MSHVKDYSKKDGIYVQPHEHGSIPWQTSHPDSHYHHQLGEKGEKVLINKPTHPSAPNTWHNPDAVATFVPGGDVPDVINDVKVVPWSSHPTTAAQWNAYLGLMPNLDEQPLKQPPGKKASAGVVVLEPDGRIWLVHPTNQFGGYRSTFPKGTLEPGLSLQATAVREVFEESGLQVHITGLLCDVKRTTSVCRLYLGERIGGSPAEMGWESQAVSLAPLAALSELLNGAADQPVIEALKQHKQIKSGEILAGGGNIVRTLEALDGFYATHGSWPSCLRMSADFLATLVTQHLSPTGFFRLQSKVRIEVEDGDLIASNAAGQQFNYSQQGWVAQNSGLTAKDWLGI